MNDCPKNLSDLCLVEKTAPPESKWDVCDSCPIKKNSAINWEQMEPVNN